LSEIVIALIVLTVILIIHLVEEIKYGFRKKLPVGEMSLRTFVSLNILIYTIIAITIILNILIEPFGIVLAWIYCIGMFLNAVGHIGIMLYKRAYFPGGISAFLILPVNIWLLTILV